MADEVVVPVAPEAVVQEQVKTTDESGQQQIEAPASLQAEVSSEPAPEATPVSVITDEEIKADITEKKNKIQKRIDKLTAEKHQYKSEIDELRNEINSLKQAKVEQPKEPQYDRETLEKAIDEGLQKGETRLVTEAIRELIKVEKNEAVKSITQKERDQEAQKARQATIWNAFKETVGIDDPDLDFDNKESAGFKYANYYLNNHADHYSKFGDYAVVQAANDARLAVEALKLRKKNGSQLQKTERELIQQKLKNSVEVGGNSTPTTQPKSSGETIGLEDYFEQRRKLYNTSLRLPPK
jgi:hypothetical protein